MSQVAADSAAWTGIAIPPDNLEDEANRGANAKRILDDPLVIEALTSMKQRVRDEFFSAALTDGAARERAWLMGQLVQRFEDCFRGMISTGDFAARRISELETTRRANLIRRAFG